MSNNSSIVSGQIEKSLIAESFSKAAKQYDDSAFFQKLAGERLFERLDYFKLEPKTILDVGSGTGYFTRKLSQRFVDAQVSGVDLSQGMVEFSRAQSTQEEYFCADAQALPFEDNSFDLLFSNLTIQWINDLDALFKELHRVLKPGGLLLFTTLGPDTLYELNHSWQQVDKFQHVNQFTDMHNVGDAMLNLGMLDPVMDSEMVAVGYKKVIELMRDLKNIGAHNLNSKRNKGLTTAKTLRALEKAYQEFALDDGMLPASYELVYGHAFAGNKEASLGYHEYALEL